MAEISSFLSDVASSAPAPGGGSCSAIALAQAAALISKVMSLSMKDASEKQKENHAESLKALERMRGLLIELADKDSQIFLDLIAAFRLPKNSPEEIEKRRIEIRTRYSEAAESPLNMIKAASPLRANIIFLMHNGNQNALSDTLCAAKLFEAYSLNIVFENYKLFSKEKSKSPNYKFNSFKICDILFFFPFLFFF